MKHLITTCMALVATASFATAAQGWSDDFEAAKAKAKQENKVMLLDFTGSDWCGWCVKLDKEVFSKAAFKDFAREKLVLVEVDFPHNKNQSKKLKEQNEALAKQFGIRGYPSIVLLDSEGKPIGKTGYQAGGPEKYVEHLKSLIGNR